MSLSTQATSRSDSSLPDNPVNKWQNFAAKEFEEHRTRTIRTRNQENRQLQQQQQQQLAQSEQQTTQPTKQPAPSMAQHSLVQQQQQQQQPVSGQQQRSTSPQKDLGSVLSWQDFAAQEESKAPVQSSDTRSLSRRTSTSFSHSCPATPKRSLSENVRRDHSYRIYLCNNDSGHYPHTATNSTTTTPLPPPPAQLSVTSPTSFSRANSSNYDSQLRYKPTLPDPTLCFCNELAHQRTTPHDGVIYECHALGGTSSSSTKNKNVTVCAFHAHKDIWDAYREILRDGRRIDKMDPALLLCPAFNLTFTIVTRLNNTYTKRLPYPPPRCYCNKPVLLDLRSIKYNHRSYFVCSDYDHIDAPLRCGFFAWADQVRCRIPDTLPHSHSSLAQPSSPPSSSSSSWQHHQQILSPSSPVPPPWSPLLSSTSYSSTSVSDHDHQQQSQQQSKPYFSADMPPFLPSSRESIPSTPSTTSARTFPINYDEDASIYTPRTSKIDNPIYALASSGRSGAKAEEGKDCSTGASDEFVRLLQGAKMPLWHTSTKEQGDPNDLRSGTSLLDALNGVKAGGGGNDNESTSASSSLPGSPQQRETTALRGVYGLLIPGSVYMRQAIKKKNTDIARAKEKQMTEEKLEELRQQIASMEETIRDLEAENQKERAAKQVKEEELSDLINKQEKHAVDAQELIQKAEKLLADKEEITASMQQVQEILAEETMLREKSQRRRIKLEMILYDILAMNESLKQEMAEKEEKLSMKDLKCRVCFQENIEFALVPCYHCSYCKACAEKLSECAICRTTKFAIQKVYVS